MGNLSEQPLVEDVIGYEQEIIGESHFQDVLLQLAGGRGKESAAVAHTAVLVPEKNNPHDAKAVRVDILGQQVGHLNREDARAYRKKYGTKQVECPALIVGGWDRGAGRQGHFGVKLALSLVQNKAEPRSPKSLIKWIAIGLGLCLCLFLAVGILGSCSSPKPTKPNSTIPAETPPTSAPRQTVATSAPSATATPQKSQSGATVAPAAKTTGPTVKTAANLRAGPGTSYAKTGSAAVGQELDIIGRNAAGDWYQVRNGAWIAAFLVNNAPVVPVADNIPTPAAAAPVPVRAATVVPVQCDCGGNTLNCDDFASPLGAQECYLHCKAQTGQDVHDLDRDGDGNACEWEG